MYIIVFSKKSHNQVSLSKIYTILYCFSKKLLNVSIILKNFTFITILLGACQCPVLDMGLTGAHACPCQYGLVAHLVGPNPANLLLHIRPTQAFLDKSCSRQALAGCSICLLFVLRIKLCMDVIDICKSN